MSLIIKLLRVNTLWIEPDKTIEFKLNYLFIQSSKSRFNINKMIVIYYIMKTMDLILFISIAEILF
jgi:hypothetical protein